MSKYRNTFYEDFKPQFLVIFSRNYRHRLVLKIPFPDYIFQISFHIFPKISKYRTENLLFLSTGKYYAPPPPPPPPHAPSLSKELLLKTSQYLRENTCLEPLFDNVAGIFNSSILYLRWLLLESLF